MNQRHLLWAANVRTKTFTERLDAAVAGNFEEMSIFPIDVRNFAQSGLTLQKLRQQATERNVRISVLDPYARWVPDVTPAPWASPSDLAFTDFTKDDIFRMADGLGVESINLIETFGNPVETETAAEQFARIAKRGGAHGLRVQLEFMPFSGIADLQKAWDIVRLADAPNGGLTFDTWHYFRGTVNETLLRSIPGETIYQVQFADAKQELNGTLVDDLLHHRRFPGEGDFPLSNLNQLLTQMGADSAIGIELFSDYVDSLTPAEVGRRLRASLNNRMSW